MRVQAVFSCFVGLDYNKHCYSWDKVEKHNLDPNKIKYL